MPRDILDQKTLKRVIGAVSSHRRRWISREYQRFAFRRPRRSVCRRSGRGVCV